ncbi:MAG: MTH1187 family thiamine-binding protein [Planctomycetes bacterium]|nr:MTH1187 family thiamine-binding protein [Planctomycetota bacterium]
MVLAEFSIFPIGRGESLSPFVARMLDIIDNSGLDYRLTAMGTIVEGQIDQVLDVMRRCLEAMAKDCDRVSCTAKLDYRKGTESRLDAKVQSVEEKLGRPLKKS